MKVSPFEKVANYLILGVFGLVILGPISVIVTLAFGPENASVAQEGRVFHWEIFPTAWEVARFGQYMLTSVVVAVIVVVVAVLASILAGYALGTMKFRGATPIFYLFLLGIMVPTEAFIVPLYFDLRTVGLTNTVWGVAFPQIAMSIAFGTFWMRTYFRSSSQALIDAAKLDGAGSMRILWQVLVPIGRPAILTLVLLTFMWTWNEFLLPLVMIVSDARRTAPLGLAFFQGQNTTDYSLLSAAGVLVALPIALLYFALQKKFISGMVGGISTR